MRETGSPYYNFIGFPATRNGRIIGQAFTPEVSQTGGTYIVRIRLSKKVVRSITRKGGMVRVVVSGIATDQKVYTGAMKHRF